ncbi:MAG: insulinase family protein, partial [Acidobacteria bacterium]|nr:insulinase family protein [Acidobacteriota bacterium]
MRKTISTAETQRLRAVRSSLLMFLSSLCLCVSVVNSSAQEKPPAPGAPRPVKLPQIVEKKLPNGLTVVTVTRKGSPLVAARLMVAAGSAGENLQSAGLANVTADLITKGTKTRDATKIAEDLEFLGANLDAVSSRDVTSISLSVTSDKLGQAMAVMSDVVLHPTFPQSELDLLKSQKVDELTANLRAPGFLTTYVASVYSFGSSPQGGTPASLQAMTRNEVVNFYSGSYSPAGATLIFVGDIDPATAYKQAQLNFGTWKRPSTSGFALGPPTMAEDPNAKHPILNR